MDSDKLISDAEVALACNLGGEQQAARERELATTLFAGVTQAAEIADGYALRFAGNDASAHSLLDFIAFERVCCPFFTFELLFEPNQGPIWLKLHGPEGVKEVLRSEWPTLTALL